jgi:hypothetical protein
MSPIEKRWLEVQMYNSLLKIYHINNDIQDVMTVIELLGTLFKIPTEPLKLLANKILYDLRTRPSKKEYATLAAYFKVPIIQIAKQTGYKVQYLYNKIKTWNINDLNLYNNYTDSEYMLIKTFIKKSQELKEWLL